MPPQLHHPAMLDERYFACSRFLLCRTTDVPVPQPLAQAVAAFEATGKSPFDEDFHEKLALLDGGADGDLISRIEAGWPRRRTVSAYRTSAPLMAGHDVSNDLSVDYQLAAILHRLGVARPRSPHAWRW